MPAFPGRQVASEFRFTQFHLKTGNNIGSIAPWRSGPPSLTIHVIPDNPGQSRRFVYVDALRDDAEKEIVMKKNGAAISLRAPAMEVATTVKVWVPQAPEKMEPHWNYEPASQILSAHFGDGQKISLTVTF